VKTIDVHIFGLLSEKKKDTAHESGYHAAPRVSSNRRCFLREQPRNRAEIRHYRALRHALTTTTGRKLRISTYFHPYLQNPALSIGTAERKQA
jgi:hypothetical protein